MHLRAFIQVIIIRTVAYLPDHLSLQVGNHLGSSLLLLQHLFLLEKSVRSAMHFGRMVLIEGRTGR